MRTFDIEFNDNKKAQSKGFELSYSEALDYVKTWNDGSGHSYFADFKEGTVSIVDNETEETVHTEPVK